MPRTSTKENKQRKSDAEFEADRRATGRLNDMLRDDFGFDAIKLCVVHESIQQTGLELVCSNRGCFDACPASRTTVSQQDRTAHRERPTARTVGLVSLIALSVRLRPQVAVIFVAGSAVLEHLPGCSDSSEGNSERPFIGAEVHIVKPKRWLRTNGDRGNDRIRQKLPKTRHHFTPDTSADFNVLPG
jgi:hypothetical protein